MGPCKLFSRGFSHWEHLQKTGGGVELWLQPLDLWVCIFFLLAPSWQPSLLCFPS